MRFRSKFAAKAKAISNNGLLVTGTDTNVGKTYVACIIARELRARQVRFRAFKPACSGAVQNELGEWRWPDLDALALAAGVDNPLDISPLRFQAPLAPPVAARAEGRTIDNHAIVEAFHELTKLSDFMLVEGVGGLLCPLSDDWLVADFAREIELPLLIVARLGLGTINHTLLTVEAARTRGLRIAGIVLSESNPGSDPSANSNACEIERLTGLSVLGIVQHGADWLRSHDSNQPRKLDWISLANG